MEDQMTSWIDFSISSGYELKYPGVGFGLTLISGCKPLAETADFDQYKRKLLRKMRKRETLSRISERIDIYDNFFPEFRIRVPAAPAFQENY